MGALPGVVDLSLGRVARGLAAFSSADHSASWAGLCPGNNESAGKHFSGRTRKGDQWLPEALVQSAWAAARTNPAA